MPRMPRAKGAVDGVGFIPGADDEAVDGVAEALGAIEDFEVPGVRDAGLGLAHLGFLPGGDEVGERSAEGLRAAEFSGFAEGAGGGVWLVAHLFGEGTHALARLVGHRWVAAEGPGNTATGKAGRGGKVDLPNGRGRAVGHGGSDLVGRIWDPPLRGKKSSRLHTSENRARTRVLFGAAARGEMIMGR